jgi:integrase/recombinase XerD
VELPLAAEEFLGWLAVERGRSANTLAAYRRDLRAYVGWLAARGLTVDRVTEPDIERWVGERRTSGAAPSSVTRALVAVRTFHRFCAEEGRTAADPAAHVAPPRKPAALPKALTEAEVTTLLDAVVGAEPVDRRNRALLELLYGTGARISEACGLSLADLDLDAGLARVFGKGAKERVVPLGSIARSALRDWLSPNGRGALEPVRWARRGDADAVFLNRRGGRLSRQAAWTVVKDYGDRVGIGDRLSPHVLRHSCATHMIEHGADIRIVQELLGHASVSTTQVYTRVSAERLRHVFDAAHPRAGRR